MARDQIDMTSVELRARACRLAGRGLQAESGLAHRHRAREVRLLSRRPLRPSPTRASAASARLLEAMEGLLGWQPIVDDGNIIGLTDPIGRRRDLARARRPVRAVRRAARDDPPDLPRGATRISPRCASAPTPLGIGFLGAGLLAEVDARRDAGHAEIALRHHDALHAEGRRQRPRHDVPHLHHPGEPRFRRRSRHGEEDARRPGAAADRHRALRQLALHRGQAQRLPVLSAPRSGSTPTATAPACCPSPSRTASASSATSTGRSTCRCISSSAATSYHDVAGASFRDLLAGRLAGAARRARDAVRLGQSPVDALPRGAPEAASSRCAAPTAAGRRICALPAFWVGLLYDQPSLDAAWELVKDWTAEERQALRDAVPCRALDAVPQPHGARYCARRARARPRRAGTRRRLDNSGRDESDFLSSLEEIVATGETPAEACSRATRRMARLGRSRIRRAERSA